MVELVVDYAFHTSNKLPLLLGSFNCHYLLHHSLLDYRLGLLSYSLNKHVGLLFFDFLEHKLLHW